MSPGVQEIRYLHPGLLGPERTYNELSCQVVAAQA